MTNEEFQKLVIEKLSSLESGQKNLENEAKKIQVKIEHKVEPKIQALYEHRDIVNSKLDAIENEVKNLSSKVDKQELEIRVIKGGKDSEDKPKNKKKKAQ